MNQTNTDPDQDHSGEIEAPPFLGKWQNLYALVLGTLAALIILFIILTNIYS